MKMNKIKISVIGDGGWGTTLAILLSCKGFPVTLWGAFPKYSDYMDKKRMNIKFLPGIKIPKDITITSDLKYALGNKELIILAVPSQYMRQVLKKIKKANYLPKAIFVNVSKGIEIGSLKRMSEVIKDELGDVRLALLSGPTIAHEVACGISTVAVLACSDKKIRKYLQEVFMTNRFRVYTSNDLIGVELGGSLKNVIAIACGISDGLGFGTNTKAALLARGLAEISRLGQAMGSKAKTFSGITGLGDLVTTCISSYSRNRFVGMQIAKGKTLKQITELMGASASQHAGIAEGVPTTKSAYALSLKYKVDMPITKEINSVLYKNKPAFKAVDDLMCRQKKEE
jgi:glycerol-3-phosphate dehydrogenase (NAD(P)+)